MRGIFRSFKETLSTSVLAPVTEMYPYEPARMTPRSRGAPGLLWNDEVDEIVCTGCRACERECPDKCIFVSLEKYSDDLTARKTMVDEFYLDLALCSYCGICVDVCPYEAIEMTPEFAYSSTDVLSMVLDKRELVQIARGMSRTTVNPPNAPGAPKPLAAAEKSDETSAKGAGGA